MKFITQTRKTDTLNGTMAASASACTLASGNFGAPSGKQIITVDYDIDAKAADFLCTINNTAVTSMTRLNGPDVEHTTGANVAMNPVDEHLNLIFNALEDGWVNPYETWTYASATTITVPAGAASRYAVGDKIKFTQTTVKYFYVTGVADTVLTVTGGTDYTVANAAITVNRFSKAASPVGFPTWFDYTPTLSGKDSMTYTNTTISLARFKIDANSVTLRVHFNGTVGGTPSTSIEATLPVACSDSSLTYNGCSIFDNGSSGVGFTKVDSADDKLKTSNSGGTNWTAGSAYVRGEIIYEIG